MLPLRAVILALMVLLSLPTALARQEMSHDEQADVDAVNAQASLYAAVGGPEDANLKSDLVEVGFLFGAQFLPTESQLSNLFSLLLSLQHQSLATGPAEPVVQEQDAIIAQGIQTSATGRATNQETEITSNIAVGSHTYGTRVTMQADDVLPSSATEFQSPEQPSEPEPEESPMEVQPAPMSLARESTPLSTQSHSLRDMPLPAALAATAAVLATSASAAIAIVPGWRTTLTRLIRRFGWLLLFSRISQEDILNHERRTELLEFVRNNPGERVEVARRTLGFSNGSMHYHLRVLQERGLVRLLKDGSRARLYPRGPKISPQPYVPAQRKRFLDALNQAPGRTQRELAQLLGLSERMVSYHVRALAQQGLIMIRTEGPRKRLFPSRLEAAIATLAPAA